MIKQIGCERKWDVHMTGHAGKYGPALRHKSTFEVPGAVGRESLGMPRKRVVNLLTSRA
jgi:hypothetical protein